MKNSSWLLASTSLSPRSVQLPLPQAPAGPFHRHRKDKAPRAAKAEKPAKNKKITCSIARNPRIRPVDTVRQRGSRPQASLPAPIPVAGAASSPPAAAGAGAR